MARKKLKNKPEPRRKCVECGDERQAAGGKGLRFFRRRGLSLCDKCWPDGPLR